MPLNRRIRVTPSDIHVLETDRWTWELTQRISLRRHSRRRCYFCLYVRQYPTQVVQLRRRLAFNLQGHRTPFSRIVTFILLSLCDLLLSYLAARTACCCRLSLLLWASQLAARWLHHALSSLYRQSHARPCAHCVRVSCTFVKYYVTGVDYSIATGCTPLWRFDTMNLSPTETLSSRPLVRRSSTDTASFVSFKVALK